MRTSTALLLTALWCVVLFAAGARAAVPPPAPSSIRTLDQALEFVTWETARRGPLVIVDPAGTSLPAPLDPPPAPGGTYRLGDIAPRLGRKLVRLPSLSVLAPTEMSVLATRLVPPDHLVPGQDASFVMRRLQATLSPAQWRLLGSARGLGAGDLAAAQRPVFLALLPDPLRVYKRRHAGDGGNNPAASRDVATLTGAQRAQVRVRLHVEATYYLQIPRTDKPGAWEDIGWPASWAYNAPLAVRRRPASDKQSAYGQILIARVPARAKPGQLLFEAPALRATVSLAGAQSVGELVRRARKATGVELYADVRMAGLPVRVWGQSVPAGDLLKALALAVTGAFRSVSAGGETAFVLADDLEGLGARRARLEDWQRTASAAQHLLRVGAYDALRQQLEKSPLWRNIGFAPEDPFEFGPATMAGYAENPAAPHEAKEVPLADLPPRAQAFVREQGARLAEKTPVATDRVRCTKLNLSVSYLVPGLGTVGDANPIMGDFSSLVPGADAAEADEDDAKENPTLVLPPDPAARAVIVAPQTVDEARRIVRAAARAGLNQVWVKTQGSDENAHPLRAALAEAATQKIALLAVIALHSRTATTTTDGAPETPLLDLNILGQPARRYAGDVLNGPLAASYLRAKLRLDADWLRPDLGQDRVKGVVRFVRTAPPGLAGLVLCDAAPLGYASDGKENHQDLSPAGWDLGYTPSARLAFLRRESVDPLDLSTMGVLPDLELPFFKNDLVERRYLWDEASRRMVPDPAQKPTPLQAWDAFRFQTNARLLTDLFAAIREQRPDLFLFLQALPQPPGGAFDQWYGSWDRAGDLPGRTPYDPSRAQPARAQSRRVLLAPAGDESGGIPAEPGAFVRFLAQQVDVKNHRDRWDGIVLDLSERPVDTVLLLLATLPAKGRATIEPETRKP